MTRQRHLNVMMAQNASQERPFVMATMIALMAQMSDTAVRKSHENMYY